MAKEKKEETVKPVSLIAARKLAEEKLVSELSGGKGSASVYLASDPKLKVVRRLSSGIFKLDEALGGGFPRGRISLIWGNRSSAKTSTVLRTIAHAQRLSVLNHKYEWECEPDEFIPHNVYYLDIEGALDTAWAERLGVQLDKMKILRPNISEEVGDIVYAALSSGVCDLLVVDSLAALTTESEIEKSHGESNVGGTSKHNASLFRKISEAQNRLWNKTDVIHPTVFILNQVSKKIGVMFGDPDTLPGGEAQKFYSSVEIKLSEGKYEFFDEDRTQPKWATFKFKVTKNKTHPPRIEGEYKVAQCNDPEGMFILGQVLDGKESFARAEESGFIVHEGNNWKIKDEVFKTKKELVEKWIANKENYVMFKRDLVDFLCGRG